MANPPAASVPALPPAAAPGDPLARVDTPSLVLDLDAFESNLRQMQAWADRHGVALRPHAKAHKCPEIARRQLALGARGICCQKVSEALPFVAAGIDDVHISNEVVGAAKLALLAQLARAARVSVCVDDAGNLADISAAMARAQAQVEVLVELDVGQGRCGVPDAAAAVALARQAQALPGVTFGGLQAYHGSVQHVRGHAERAAVAARAAQAAAECARQLRAAGIPCDRITGAGTGSAEFDAASGVYTEMQAGSYAFMDGDYGANAWSGPLAFRHSLFLLATVMSMPAPGRAVVDAGLKSTTIECGLPQVAGGAGLQYAAANDEHGVLKVAADAALRLGDTLLLIPAHVDPTFNLHDSLVAYRDGVVEGVWDISARGLSR
ncbi:DSD1 family PLP-dependent enzyme [Bordetella petrii]|uniref:Amino acid aldolase or racemase n=1 Tax=Bordetella petrii (strain ATCC BAA-461 / DSM 12804 / CCUG 43448 / CIP 107267 / Se-1111R) TaxID=340100 RepID=A9HVP2_BORPD|nr:DSD1 family PLP-dependent enzyme [Bordetella petrii]CAP40372.1 putative amino acid aldolase or racemase [Bordetella petrii]